MKFDEIQKFEALAGSGRHLEASGGIREAFGGIWDAFEGFLEASGGSWEAGHLAWGTPNPDNMPKEGAKVLQGLQGCRQGGFQGRLSGCMLEDIAPQPGGPQGAGISSNFGSRPMSCG